MIESQTFANKVLEFNEWLSNKSFDLPDPYGLKNPYNNENKEQIRKITHLFYNKYYNDRNKRKLILGSSPARRGTASTGIPFEDANHLYKETGIMIENFYVNKSSSNFLYEVMERYGGCEKFYKDFFMSFICPFGIVKINSKGSETNLNYYDNKQIEAILYDFIVECLKKQISLGIDTSVCYCIGSGENYKFLTKINREYLFFDKIVPLEHPRFIMQYHSIDKDYYLEKYLTTLKN